ncbi:uncharacterized protein [Lolium perenne]|uniref:uncharacterized protein n=1 Tax=Lolium perenne TaxID=4522 RepID=UPI0021EAAF7D|nr:leucine-rich repeat extensin-like protein 3 [Lolium perenne]
MGRAGWRAETRKIHGGPLTLEKYHRFFVDPWGDDITNDQLSQILTMHAFLKLPANKRKIMKQLVAQIDLQPPRRSTLHSAAAAARPSAVRINARQVAADVDAIGWTENPIGAVAAFAGYGEGPPERLERFPPPADHVISLALALRRARSRRTRRSAYARRAASVDVKVKEEDVEEPPPSPPPLWTRSPTPSPPPLWTRSPTPSPPPLWKRSPTPPPPPPSPPCPQSVAPPPPASPPRPQTVVPPPPTSPPRPQTAVPPPPSSPPRQETAVPPPPSSPSCRQPNLETIFSPPPPGFGPPVFGSLPRPSCARPTFPPLPTPPTGFVSPPPPPCSSQPTLAPLPTPPPGFGSPQVTPPPPQLFWGLPLPMAPPPAGPGAPPAFAHHLQPAGQRPSVPSCYPAACWGAPSVLPPQQAPWRWPHPPPRWTPPHMTQQQRPPPPWGFMEPSAPPPMPLQHQPHFEGQEWPQPTVTGGVLGQAHACVLGTPVLQSLC